MTPEEQLLQFALDMHAGGCNLIPVAQTKKPLFKWEVYQEQRVPASRIRKWAADPRTKGFAVIGGQISGGVEVLDFDAPELYPHFLAAAPDWALDLPAQRTGGGGYQIVYRRSGDVPGNRKLARLPAFDADGVKIDGRAVGIETRGTGGYAVIPHSLHPSGARYEPLGGNWADIPRLTGEQADALIELARTFDHAPQPEPAPVKPARPAQEAGRGKLTGKTPEERAAQRRAREAAAALREECATVAGAREGERNDTLNRAAFNLGTLVGAGDLSEAEAVDALTDAAHAAGLDGEEIHATVNSGMSGGKAKPRDPSRYEAEEREREARRATQKPRKAPAGSESGYTLPSFPHGTQEGTDEANAVILASNGLHSRLRFTLNQGWYVYDQARGVWVRDPSLILAAGVAGEVLRAVVGQHHFDLMKRHADQEEIAHAARWASSVCSVGTVSRALTAAAGKPEFLTPVDAWDARPELLNCPNGTLELTGGTLRPHDPADLMTWQAGAAYDPAARHPFVDRLLDLLRADGRHDLLQRWAGSTLYGRAPNEKFVVLSGPGGTGKGTLADALKAALGEYAHTIDVGLILHNAHGDSGTGPKPELLKLQGKRLVIASEPDQYARFNAGRVKGMTGNDPITARGMRSNDMVTFTPVFKLCIQTNYPIKASHDDSGLQRRIIVVPFSARPAVADESFKETLKADPVARAAFLNWLVDGCRLWLSSGFSLGESAVVQEATAGYWKDQNPYERFAAARLTFGEGLEVPSGQLRPAFEDWAAENGVKLGRTVKFAELYAFLGQRGARSVHTRSGNVWEGVGLSVNPVNAVNPNPQLAGSPIRDSELTWELPSQGSQGSRGSDDVNPAGWIGDDL